MRVNAARHQQGAVRLACGPNKLGTLIRGSRRVTCVAVANSLDVQALQAVRPVDGLQELTEVARLRAEAYYEEERSRFVESFKKKFVGQEVQALQERTAPLKGSGAPLCECLVAVDPASSRVVGCIDLRLPCSATSKMPVGVPSDDQAGCYILNVVVEEEQRGKGVGKALMRAAMKRAVDRWSSQRLYTHVAADNEVAYRLYTSCGFKEHSVDAKFEHALNLGRLVLLQATADAA